MPDSPVRVAVTGAAGQIGYALLFRIASGQMFGPERPVRLQLLELPAALPALDGVRMELDDCAFPLLDSVVCTSDTDEAFADANWALLVGAVPRREGMERKDLLSINGGIFTGQGEAIARTAADDCRVLVVGNPCNTNALIGSTAAARHGMPRDRWFAMTMLDESRGRSQLAAKAGVPVARSATWPSGATTRPPSSPTRGTPRSAAGRRPRSSATTPGWRASSSPGVQQRGAAIIKARGQSSAASAANAVIDTVRNVTQPDRRDLQRGHPGAGARRLRRARRASSSATRCAPPRRGASRSCRASSTASSPAPGSRPPPPSSSRSEPPSRSCWREHRGRRPARPTRSLRVGDREVELPIVRGTEGDDAIDIGRLRGETGTDHLRPRLRQHRRVHERRHLPRRRGGRPALSRLPDRAARRALHVPRGRLPADLGRASDAGAARPGSRTR